MKKRDLVVTQRNRPDKAPAREQGTGTGSSPPEDESFPLPDWERYQGGELLGKGGMGRVFLAYEPLLKRQVALKFVRRDDGELVRRLLEEARAQARVKHERICEVYEVGEHEGQPYIAMQFIDGQSLGKLSAPLTVKQKVRLFRDAAEGVQAAHRENLIHRDIKPANILVERTQDGRLKPYIMDFGLARDWRERHATVTGSILGTPEYMSPEQARGEVSKLDRRTDVYSLGATLYELLTGAVPFSGGNELEVLNRVLAEEPRPPRQLNPEISRDLETIVLRCLEKDRLARYGSVTELIEDLNRFLADEPIPRLGLGYWLRKKARKHRVLVSVASVSLLAVALTLGWAAYTRARTGRFVREFTEKERRVEVLALASGLTKPHDTREDQRLMRQELAELEAEVDEAGSQLSGPGRDSLARGYLLLGDLETALTHLEAAWEGGFQEPQVAYSLALVLGRLYQRQLLEAEGSGSNPKQREARKREVHGHFRPRILASLKASNTRPEGRGESPERSLEHVEALMAFYEDRFDEALEKLSARADARAWDYAPLQLRGDIHRARATHLWSRGDIERARAGFAAGREAYAAALEIGRSVPDLYLAQGELALAELILELYKGGDIQPAFKRGVEAVKRGLVVSPDQPELHLLEAGLYRRAAEYELAKRPGPEPEKHLEHALEQAHKALGLRPSARAHLEVGQCYTLWGQSLLRRGEDPSERLNEAARHFEQAMLLGPPDRSTVLNAFGVVYETKARHAVGRGRDPSALLDKAIEFYEQATRLGKGLFSAWVNLADVYCMRATQRLSATPAREVVSAVEQDLKSAREAALQARSIDDQRVILYYTEGRIHELEAQVSRARGDSSLRAWNQAIESYRQGLRLEGTEKPSYLFHSEGIAFLELARDLWDRGGDPLSALDGARAAFEGARTEASDEETASYNLVDELLVRAQLQFAQGDSPEASLREAIGGAVRNITQLKDLSQQALLGVAYTLLAEFELEQGRDARQSIAKADELLRDALARESQDARVLLYRGVLHGLRARARAQVPAVGEEDFQRALGDFQQAIHLAPGVLDYRIALGRFCQQWAASALQAGKDPRQPLECGLEQARHVLAARARWADGVLLQSSLLMLQAEGAPSPTERAQYGHQALRELDKALELNPHLAPRWGHQRDRLRQLLQTLP